MQPHHVGYLVKDIPKAVHEFEQIGYQVETETIYDAFRDIDICFVTNGALKVELVKPKSEQSVVYNLAKKLGVTPYHICYIVDDVKRVGNELRDKGYVPMGIPQHAPALNDVMAAFFYNKQLGIVEIIGRE